jgi:transposase
MEVFGIVKEFSRLSKLVFPELSQKELDRLRAIILWQETKDTRLICDTFGMSRATLYRWLQRFDPADLTTLREGSRRPRRVRQPVWSYVAEKVDRVSRRMIAFSILRLTTKLTGGSGA